jgi:hypothetical protein
LKEPILFSSPCSAYFAVPDLILTIKGRHLFCREHKYKIFFEIYNKLLESPKTSKDQVRTPLAEWRSLRSSLTQQQGQKKTLQFPIRILKTGYVPFKRRKCFGE